MFLTPPVVLPVRFAICRFGPLVAAPPGKVGSSPGKSGHPSPNPQNKAPAGMSAQNPDFFRKNKAPAGMSAENPYFLRKNRAPAGMPAGNSYFLMKNKAPAGMYAGNPDLFDEIRTF